MIVVTMYTPGDRWGYARVRNGKLVGSTVIGGYTTPDLALRGAWAQHGGNVPALIYTRRP